MWHQRTLPPAFRLFVHFIGNFHAVISVLSNYQRLSQSVRFRTLSSRRDKGQNRTKVAEKWRTTLFDVLLWPVPLCTWSINEKGVRDSERRAVVFAWCFEWVKNQVRNVSLGKVTWLESLLWVQTVRGIQRLYILFIVCVCAYSPACLVFSTPRSERWCRVGLQQQRPRACGALSAGYWCVS